MTTEGYDIGPPPTPEVSLKLHAYPKVTKPEVFEVISKIVTATRQGTDITLNHWECYVLTNYFHYQGAFIFESELEQEGEQK